jgi:hypothetical protein
MDEERCPGCGGQIIDGVCPLCTLPIPGLHPLEPDPPKAPVAPPGSPRVHIAVNVLVLALGLYWIVTAGLQFVGQPAWGRTVLGLCGRGPESERGSVHGSRRVDDVPSLLSRAGATGVGFDHRRPVGPLHTPSARQLVSGDGGPAPRVRGGVRAGRDTLLSVRMALGDRGCAPPSREV